LKYSSCSSFNLSLRMERGNECELFCLVVIHIIENSVTRMVKEMKVWVNIDIPLKKYTVHYDACPFVVDMEEKTKQGWEKKQGTGGWEHFQSKEEALDYYRVNYGDKLMLSECGFCHE